MTHPFYDFTVHNEALWFEFDSVGKRTIRKIVLYQELPVPNVYNLALGDIDENGQANFKTTSDNGDRDMILATVIQTMIAFFEQKPQASISFTGGDSTLRTRLYQAAIARELEQASERFLIYGVTDNDLEPFERNKTYHGFVISLKHS